MVLFIGNLNVRATEQDLVKLFKPYGPFIKIQVITDMRTRRSRGFAYILLEEADNGYLAIEQLHNKSFMGQLLVVTDRGPRHSFGEA